MKKSIKVLLVDDDRNLGELLASLLESRGYDADLAITGESGFEMFNKNTYDFCVLDVVMPGMDGFELAKEIRQIDKNVPILFLSAKSLKKDKLTAFSLGADDYVTKPFTMDELIARIEAILRRTSGEKEQDVSYVAKLGNIKYNPTSRLLYVTEPPLKLTTKENQLLNLLYKNKGEVLDRQAALRAVWGDDNYFNSRSMDVYISKLRKILKGDDKIEIINVHGKGFQLIVREE